MNLLGKKYKDAIPEDPLKREPKDKLVASDRTKLEKKKARILNAIQSVTHQNMYPEATAGENVYLNLNYQSNKDSMLNALNLELNQIANAEEDSKIDQVFIENFLDWIQGKVPAGMTKEEQKRTENLTWWWWRDKRTGHRNSTPDPNRAPDPNRYELSRIRLHGEDFVAYIRLMISLRHDFWKKMAILRTFIPQNLNEAWLYWKYIINGTDLLESDYLSVIQDDLPFTPKPPSKQPQALPPPPPSIPPAQFPPPNQLPPNQPEPDSGATSAPPPPATPPTVIQQTVHNQTTVTTVNTSINSVVTPAQPLTPEQAEVDYSNYTEDELEKAIQDLEANPLGNEKNLRNAQRALLKLKTDKVKKQRQDKKELEKKRKALESEKKKLERDLINLRKASDKDKREAAKKLKDEEAKRIQTEGEIADLEKELTDEQSAKEAAENEARQRGIQNTKLANQVAGLQAIYKQKEAELQTLTENFDNLSNSLRESEKALLERTLWGKDLSEKLTAKDIQFQEAREQVQNIGLRLNSIESELSFNNENENIATRMASFINFLEYDKEFVQQHAGVERSQENLGRQKNMVSELLLELEDVKQKRIKRGLNTAEMQRFQQRIQELSENSSLQNTKQLRKLLKNNVKGFQRSQDPVMQAIKRKNQLLKRTQGLLNQQQGDLIRDYQLNLATEIDKARQKSERELENVRHGYEERLKAEMTRRMNEVNEMAVKASDQRNLDYQTMNQLGNEINQRNQEIVDLRKEMEKVKAHNHHLQQQLHIRMQMQNNPWVGQGGAPIPAEGPQWVNPQGGPIPAEAPPVMNPNPWVNPQNGQPIAAEGPPQVAPNWVGANGQPIAAEGPPPNWNGPNNQPIPAEGAPVMNPNQNPWVAQGGGPIPAEGYPQNVPPNWNNQNNQPIAAEGAPPGYQFAPEINPEGTEEAMDTLEAERNAVGTEMPPEALQAHMDAEVETAGRLARETLEVQQRYENEKEALQRITEKNPSRDEEFNIGTVEKNLQLVEEVGKNLDASTVMSVVAESDTGIVEDFIDDTRASIGRLTDANPQNLNGLRIEYLNHLRNEKIVSQPDLSSMLTLRAWQKKTQEKLDAFFSREGGDKYERFRRGAQRQLDTVAFYSALYLRSAGNISPEIRQSDLSPVSKAIFANHHTMLKDREHALEFSRLLRGADQGMNSYSSVLALAKQKIDYHQLLLLRNGQTETVPTF